MSEYELRPKIRAFKDAEGYIQVVIFPGGGTSFYLHKISMKDYREGIYHQELAHKISSYFETVRHIDFLAMDEDQGDIGD